MESLQRRPLDGKSNLDLLKGGRGAGVFPRKLVLKQQFPTKAGFWFGSLSGKRSPWINLRGGDFPLLVDACLCGENEVFGTPPFPLRQGLAYMDLPLITLNV